MDPAAAPARLRAPSAVGVADGIVLRDDARNRVIVTKTFYPLCDGRFPVVVFSHGFGGTKDSYDYLGRRWASAGYVVIHPTHNGTDAAAFGGTVIRLIAGRMGPTDVERQLVARALDISFVLSSLARIESAVPRLRDSIDASRVGVAGHSAGAGTALLIGGATMRGMQGGRRSAGDDRVQALIGMSPTGSGLLGFDDRSWGSVARPAMTMTGTADIGIIAQSVDWRREPFDQMPAGDKHHVVLSGANHYTFADPKRMGWARFLTGHGESGDPLRMRACVVELTTAFWDAHLKGDVARLRLLRPTSGFVGEFRPPMFADVASVWSK